MNCSTRFVERIVNELGDDPGPAAPCGRVAALSHRHGPWGAPLRPCPSACFPAGRYPAPAAPWVNPPLRSLRWVDAMLTGLAGEGFSDEKVLFTYRTFNSFLLGYLLLETSAMTLRDPKPGDGSSSDTDTVSGDGGEPASRAAANPVVGGLSPARSAGQREALEDADGPRELIDPADEIDTRRFPTVHRLTAGLAEDRWDGEFQRGLEDMLDRIAASGVDGPDHRRD